MLEGEASTAQLIGQARQGDVRAQRQLFDQCREGLLARLRETTGLAQIDEHRSTEFVSQTLNEAERRFGQFSGTGEEELRAWLDDLLQQCIVSNRPGDPSFQHQGDATLPPASNETTLQADGGPGPDGEDDPHHAETSALPATPTMRHAETLQPPTPAPDAHQADTLDQPVAGKDPHYEETWVPTDKAAQEYITKTRKRFGKYELIGVIAKGGMGVVHKARDTKLNRTVALKMILSGQFADSAEVARFYAEAESAAKLRHPNIVAIHEFGESDGQHFFSMDYIDGQSLSDVVREHPLPPDEAATLVRKTAAAMHYAHSQKILHRDLKPSNVLLDPSGEPMITDFGLAKHVEQQSQLTVSGTVLGTPSYMPPEQAAGRLEEITAQSDVYSIGAILYELLTGRPPFRAANAVETLKQVLDTEPLTPRLLNPAVPVDLETICSKCLQKERSARYQTAEEVAEELGRFLAGEPILARPIGPAARCWRWCRRNPRIATLAALAIFGFIAAFAATTIGYVTTSAALTRAEQSLNQLRIAIDRLYTLVSETELLNEPGMQPFRKELLAEARNLYEETLKQQGDHPAIRHELSLSYFRLGRIMQDLDEPDEALGALNKARRMQHRLVKDALTAEHLASLGDTLNVIGQVYEKLERHDEALDLYDEAIRVRERLVEHTPQNVQHHRKLTNVYMNSGLIERAIAEGLSDAAAKAERYQSALDRLRRAQQQRVTLMDNSSSDPELRLDIAKGYYNLGNIAFEMERDDIALQNLQRAVEQFTILLEQEPGNLDYQFLGALCHVRVGDVVIYSQDPSAAHDSYQKAQEILNELVTENPDVHKYQGALAGAHLNQGILHVELTQDDSALESLKRAREILEPLVKEFPLPQYQQNLESTVATISEVRQRLGEDNAPVSSPSTNP